LKQATPTKDETSLLAPFVGLTLSQIYVPSSVQEFEQATTQIQLAGLAGFDTESKPTFAKGEVSEGPHTVQFALDHCAYIFQTLNPHSRSYLAQLLASKQVLKVGFGLESDRQQIRALLNVDSAGVEDLNVVFRREGFARTAGVRAAVAIVMNQKFHKSKRVTTSNWAANKLSDQQLLYAANDAYAALKVLQALNEKAVGGNVFAQPATPLGSGDN
jgi:hypothetical protein